jgi:hypothetical protein
MHKGYEHPSNSHRKKTNKTKQKKKESSCAEIGEWGSSRVVLLPLVLFTCALFFLLAIRLSASRTFLSEPATSHESNNNYFSHKINQHQPPAN